MREFKVILTISEVRSACIKHNLYTAGTCEQYERMFSMIPEIDGITPEVIHEMAEDIFHHSRTELSVEDIEDILVYNAKVFLTDSCEY